MDTLWSPWRYRYVSRQSPTPGCVFCRIASSVDEDETSLVVYRGQHVYIVLNRFPYSTGHLMIVPFAHVPDLASLEDACLLEMMQLARRAEQALRLTYQPGGFNLGLNLGECAGAGIAAHLHLHILPRWTGDANFMTTIGETRVIPEDLAETWRKLRPCFKSGETAHCADPAPPAGRPPERSAL